MTENRLPLALPRSRHEHPLPARRLHPAAHRHADAPDAVDPRRRERDPALRPARPPRRASSASTSSAPRRTPTASGPLVPEVAALCDTTLAKFHFSAPAEDGFLSPPAGRAQHLRRRRLRSACLRDADRGRPARRRSCGEVGGRRGRLAPSAQPARRHRARARMGADVVTTEMVIFEWLRHQRASEVQAAAAADPLTRRRRLQPPVATTIRPRTRPAISASALAIAPSSGTSSVIRSSALRIEVAGQALPGRAAQRQRRHHAVDAGERHAAQDEGHHRARQVVPCARPQAATTPP